MTTTTTTTEYRIECTHDFVPEPRWLQNRDGDVVTFPTFQAAHAKRDELQAAQGYFSRVGYRVREVARG